MSENTGQEQPIFVENAQFQRHHDYAATNGDAIDRVPVRLREIWNEYDAIPNTPNPGLIADGAVVGVVQLVKGLALAQVAGTTQKFEHAADPTLVTQVIPASMGLDAPVSGSLAPTLLGSPATGYTPVIQDSTGTVFPQGASEWFVDGINHFVEFPNGVPATMSPPFTLTYCKYIGTFGGNSGAGPVPAPDVIDLWVSTAGNDVTGDGTQLNPYLTIERALEDVRATGWNNTATITIDAAGGNFIFPQGEMSFNAGTGGAQRTPLRIKGSGRTVVFTDTVGAESVGAVSNIVSFTSAAPQAWAVGQQVRFTTGPYAALVLSSEFSTPVQVDVSVATTDGASNATIPFSWPTGPGVGSAFSVETLDTTVEITDTLKIRSDANQIIFEDFNIVAHTSVLYSGIYVYSTTFATYGINITVDPACYFRFANVGAPWFAGRYDDNLATGLIPTTKSLYVDATGAGSLVLSTAADGIVSAPRTWAYAVVAGGASSATFAFDGVLYATLWLAGPPIGPQAGGDISVDRSETRASPNSYAIDVENGRLKVDRVNVTDPQGSGAIRVRNEGDLLIGSNFGMTATVADMAGILVEENGRLVSQDGITCDAFPGVVIEVRTGGSLVAKGGITITNNTGSSAGIALSNGGTLISDDNVAVITKAAGDGITMDNGASMVVNGALDVNAIAAGIGLLMDNKSKATVKLTLGALNNLSGVFMSTDSELNVLGAMSCRNNTNNGCIMSGGSRLAAHGAGIIDLNGQNLNIQGGAEAIFSSTLVASTAVTSRGILLQEKGSLIVRGTLTVTACATEGVVLAENSSLYVDGIFTATGNTGTNIVVNGASTLTTGTNLLAGSGTVQGIVLGGSELNVGVDLDISNSGGAALTATAGSTIIVNGTVTLTSVAAGGAGLTLSESSMVANQSLAADGRTIGISAANKSSLTVAGAVTTSNSTTHGIHLDSSSATFGGTVTSDSNGSNGLLLEAGSRLEGTGVGNWSAQTNSLESIKLTKSYMSIKAATLNADKTATGTLDAMALDASQFVTEGNLSVQGAPVYGFNSTNNSKSTIGGSINATNAAGAVGIRLNASKLKVNDLVANTCGSYGVEVRSMSKLNVAATVTMTGNSSNGIQIAGQSYAQFGGAASIASNAGTGVVVADASELYTISTLGGGLNGVYGVALVNGSRMVATILPTITGTIGDALVGTNAVATWATISAALPSNNTDYSAAGTASQFCTLVA